MNALTAEQKSQGISKIHLSQSGKYFFDADKIFVENTLLQRLDLKPCRFGIRISTVPPFGLKTKTGASDTKSTV